MQTKDNSELGSRTIETTYTGPGVEFHTCNPRYSGHGGRRIVTLTPTLEKKLFSLKE
jgi:hypothetical protein